jgi:DhnA family fructose-bisphosphate aldolase class Ia
VTDTTTDATLDLLDTPTGNAVVIALDHGLSLGAVDGYRRPTETIDTVLSGDPDGVLVGPHMYRRFRDRFEAAGVDAVLTADCVTFSTRPGYDEGEELWTPAFDPEFLVELDPVGVKVVLVFGREDGDLFIENVAYVAEMAEQLRGTGVPLVVEPVLWGPRVLDRFETDPEHVERAARMAWEYGADILKLPYTGDPDSFARTVEAAPVPSFILGGPASGTTRETLSDVAAAVDCGARGVMIGRSVWKADDVSATVSALRRVVHEGASVEDVCG